MRKIIYISICLFLLLAFAGCKKAENTSAQPGEWMSDEEIIAKYTMSYENHDTVEDFIPYILELIKNGNFDTLSKCVVDDPYLYGKYDSDTFLGEALQSITWRISGTDESSDGISVQITIDAPNIPKMITEGDSSKKSECISNYRYKATESIELVRTNEGLKISGISALLNMCTGNLITFLQESNQSVLDSIGK